MKTATKQPPATARPTHVAVECRLTTEEAEALAYALDRLDGLLGRCVMGTGCHDRDVTVAAVRKVLARTNDAIPADYDERQSP